MSRTTMTSKGQITVPHEIRAALKLVQGDQLQIEVVSNGFEARLVRRPTAASLQGILKSEIPYQSQEAERQAVAEALAEKFSKQK
ncbi:AbrB/MazE/SpoVT family DNA-binding domain-containing protein [Deinococcus detaillensis]|uniref:AbrB/MazE/SpoVT family DNA-binding domain-containing protein n=1 Tax=Deinococcus detaillensis TaxID=2592048 RepID=A0A553V2M0_9DEIO|nr:AbrB/MazE/SpoVT family DNA-binding domain-containing protein [Deinococcus detaillensis]TSA86723.1 AbrB/MazE/SpoVT family DNA-binding domain-containing protein [Deinococcus detaillensis]